ncbi:hypothetical protein [uncultured Desulfovibrio sp.]|uniref:hypothetical protein n=1 Tax=uncultured Desulfovibrio sp. TaxID=167968 RepID=UPI00263A6FE0|nr:hypothetical protein [uncultured Desulfovibrio sp.]
MPDAPSYPVNDAADRLDTVLAMLEALQDGMFTQENLPVHPLTFYPQGRAGMSYILDSILDKLREAAKLLEEANDTGI